MVLLAFIFKDLNNRNKKTGQKIKKLLSTKNSFFIKIIKNCSSYYAKWRLNIELERT